MTQEERDKITAFVASMGFEHSDDLRTLTAIIEGVLEGRVKWAASRAEREAAEWAPGGWRREPTQ